MFTTFAMNISFTDKKLQNLSSDFKKCRQKMGDRRAKLFVTRLNALKDATTLEDVRHLPGHFHELTGDRKGQWGCELDHPYRLIFRPQETPIPTNEHGQYVWLEILGVEIVEIIDYH
ncbi:MAG: type II toxin-antitoxin system RelE/ParE family toxin [Saprospiraceae bacterium]